MAGPVESQVLRSEHRIGVEKIAREEQLTDSEANETRGSDGQNCVGEARAPPDAPTDPRKHHETDDVCEPKGYSADCGGEACHRRACGLGLALLGGFLCDRQAEPAPGDRQNNCSGAGPDPKLAVPAVWGCRSAVHSASLVGPSVDWGRAAGVE